MNTGIIASSFIRALASISIDPTSEGVNRNGETYQIVVTTTENWTISGNVGITVSPSSGSGNTTVSVTIPANNSQITTVGYIDFNVPGNSARHTWQQPGNMSTKNP
jgi:Mrp family chromosome partitioning ATPase